MKKDDWNIRWLPGMAKIPPEQWDRLAVPLATPLLEWRWLHELEASGSIAPAAGWQPCHLTLWRDNRLAAAAPFYIKAHSQGEFVFDQQLAVWAQKAGLAYYPKLVGMSPVTPVAGYRFLVDPQEDAACIQKTMLTAVDHLCNRLKLSGCHLLFTDPQWRSTLPFRDWIAWDHQSYLWRNPGHATFDEYLGRFKSSQRRNIRRERRSMSDRRVTIRILTGDDIRPELAALMYRYYLNTNEQFGPWGCEYLNAAFFDRIFRHYRHRLVIMAAYHRDTTPVALAMLLVKNRHLIGRYWGCAEPMRDLHFNLCYYEPIRWAIANGIRTFDPGAGSPHKIYRGFAAIGNTSLHRFYNQQLQAVFERLTASINPMEQDNIDALNARLPFAASR